MTAADQLLQALRMRGRVASRDLLALLNISRPTLIGAWMHILAASKKWKHNVAVLVSMSYAFPVSDRLVFVDLVDMIAPIINAFAIQCSRGGKLRLKRNVSS